MMLNVNDCIVPNWPAPLNIRALFTTRYGGVSHGLNGVYASLNLGDHVHDRPEDVRQNRALLREILPSEPVWMTQVHGTLPIWIDRSLSVPVPAADAALTGLPGVVCAVMVADCLPVFLCDTAGSVVGVVHAGWRGLAGGIIEQSVSVMKKYGNGDILAWMGPAIGPKHFEVGAEVREVFSQHDCQSEQAFVAADNQNKWYANLFLLARQRLAQAGVLAVYGGDVCTYSDPARFYSFRRDGQTGRMAALIWLDKMSI